MEENENKNVVNPQEAEQLKNDTPQENEKVEEKKEAPKKDSEPPKKKKAGAGKVILITLVIVLCILFIGLLIRMLIAGDNDYFKPVKEMFGIEEPEEKKSSKVAKGEEDDEDDDEESSINAAKRYTLLSEETKEDGVTHYRMTIDTAKFLSKTLDYYKQSVDETNKILEKSKEAAERAKSATENNVSSNYSSNTSDDEGEVEDETAEIFEKLNDAIKGDLGETYIDIYFDGNDFIQAVIGSDYGKSIEKIWKYVSENKDEVSEYLDEYYSYIDDSTYSLTDEEEEMLTAFKDAVEDFMEAEDANEAANSLLKLSKKYMTKETIYDMIFANDEDEIMEETGFTEKDIKAAFDIVNAKGLTEIYINGTSKIQDEIDKLIDDDDFEDQLEELEDEENISLDKDNLFESGIKALNKVFRSEEYIKDFNLQFKKIN